MALIYMQANADDFADAFAHYNDNMESVEGKVNVNGEIHDVPTEDEIERALFLVQG